MVRRLTLLQLLQFLPISQCCFQSTLPQPFPSSPTSFLRSTESNQQQHSEQPPPLENGEPQRQQDSSPTLEWLASQLAASQYRHIVVVNGAGVSVNAGIPDFRTPGTGLYSKLEEYQLPYPEAVFELDYFRQHPQPFVDIAKAIWPGQEEGPRPTLAHAFLVLLERRGLLKRVYTQNIDGLESLAGVSKDKLIECHGHFRSCSCISQSCRTTVSIDKCRESYITQGSVYSCPECGSPVKPDIVFFGEELPSIFMDRIHQDMDTCDLLIVMGTSLLVDPVASIPRWVGRHVPRLLINRERVGAFLVRGRPNEPKRDIFAQGDCDDGVQQLCQLVGADWGNDLLEIHKAGAFS